VQVVSEEVVEALLKGRLLLLCWQRFKATWRYSFKKTWTIVSNLLIARGISSVWKTVSTDFFFKGNPSGFVSVVEENVETLNLQFHVDVTIVKSWSSRVLLSRTTSPWPEQITNYLRYATLLTLSTPTTETHQTIKYIKPFKWCVVWQESFSRITLFISICYPTWMRGNFGLNLQNSPKLPPIHARLYCYANSDVTRSVTFLATSGLSLVKG